MVPHALNFDVLISRHVEFLMLTLTHDLWDDIMI